MKAFVLQSRGSAEIFLVDDSGYSTETAFESHVLRCLNKVYAHHRCVVFGGTFTLDGESHRADLALVARDFSHWFVIEVELLSHSFEGHVLPQVRTLRYGDLSIESAAVLAREMSIGVGEAKTLINRVPRATAVISNGFSESWSMSFRAMDVQYLAILPYSASSAAQGYEVQGELEIIRRSVGFGTYDAVASAVRMPAAVHLPMGDLLIEGPDGVLGEWKAVREGGHTWLLKAGARLECQNRAYVQIMKASGGKLSLRI